MSVSDQGMHLDELAEAALRYFGVTTCERHPDKLWSGAHPEGTSTVDPCPSGCAGPGMPLSESLAHLGELRMMLREMAEDNSPHDVQALIQDRVEIWGEE